VGRDHCVHRIPATGTKQGKYQHTFKISANRGKCHIGKSTQKYTTTTTIYC
jgi:hypothetical protein